MQLQWLSILNSEAAARLICSYVTSDVNQIIRELKENPEALLAPHSYLMLTRLIG